jgi:hypothetical protein
MASQFLATLTKICHHLVGCQILAWQPSHLAMPVHFGDQIWPKLYMATNLRQSMAAAKFWLG